MAIDAGIEAIFGQPPAGTDLTEQATIGYNVASITFFVVATLSVALRFYVRVKNNTLGRDDYLVVAGLVSRAASFEAGTIPEVITCDIHGLTDWHRFDSLPPRHFLSPPY